MQVLTFAIQKGGGGKTSSCLAIAQAAAKDGRKVLVIDLDPQGNATFTLQADPNRGGSYDLLANGTPARRIIQQTAGNIDVIPASWGLSTITSSTGSAKRLQTALKPIRGKYDLIIIDTPPQSAELQYNALQAATGLIIPLQADVYGLQGLFQIAETAEAFKKSNPELQIKGFILTRHNGRSTLAKQMQERITERAAALNIPFLGTIRAGVAIQEAQLTRQNLFDYAPNSNPAKDYLALYNKIMEA